MSTPVVVSKDNLKQTETKGYPFAKLKEQNIEMMSMYLNWLAYPYNRHVGVDHVAWTQCLKFSPNGWMNKWNKSWWMMIDELKVMLQIQNLQ